MGNPLHASRILTRREADHDISVLTYSITDPMLLNEPTGSEVKKGQQSTYAFSIPTDCCVDATELYTTSTAPISEFIVAKRVVESYEH